jgi:hypothetical protein
MKSLKLTTIAPARSTLKVTPLSPSEAIDQRSEVGEQTRQSLEAIGYQ